MVMDKTTTRLYRSGPRGYLYLRRAFIEDSQFPFDYDEEVDVKIEGKKLIVTKSKKK